MQRHNIIIPNCDDNLPVGEVFGRLFDTIAKIVSELDVVTIDNKNVNYRLLNACIEFYCNNFGHKVLVNNVSDYVFDVDEKNIDYSQSLLGDFLDTHKISNINPIRYFVDEMMCNIKEHSKAEKGLLFYWHSSTKNTIDICVADNGISILGSYVQNQLYLDHIGDSDAKAITLAKKGFSTKNRPDAENRGFGISSNINMITNGLQGSMYVLSGTGLLLCKKDKTEILSMPAQTEWSGTLIFAEIPLNTPKEFDFYKYM